MTRTETVRDVAFKEGRSGTLCFVTVDHAMATERGVAIRERQDIVYREAAAAQAGRPVEAERDSAEAYARVWAVPATPTLLFRYSAMTFNGHRFHYDQPYATQVEGYADLVVHGPDAGDAADEPRGHAARIGRRAASPIAASRR